MSDDTDFADAYTHLDDAADDARWAFGTGFDDPLAGLDTRVPDGLDRAALADLCLGLGDDALVLAQRLSEWTAHAPELEEEMALANIALDLLGQARLFLARAATAHPDCLPVLAESPVPDDDRLAYFRGPADFRNVQAVELPNGDFAHSTARLWVLSVWRLARLTDLLDAPDPVVAAIAAKGVKEVRYHADHAAHWLRILAGGTEVSRARLEAGLAALWPYVGELAPAPDLSPLLAELGLDRPIDPPLAGPLGRDGRHTEHLAHLLDEMQSVARAHPQGRW